MECHFNNKMFSTNVIKRNGKKEEVKFDKIQDRIKNLSKDLNINPTTITQKVSIRIYDGINTFELDDLVSQIASSMSTSNTDYGILADRIVISNNHKNTSESFVKTMEILYNNKDKNEVHCPLISEEVYNISKKYANEIEEAIDYEKDYKFDFFGFNTLKKAYLMKINGNTIERIQHMLMRVSIGLYLDDKDSFIKSYELLSNKNFIHATPTLFNAGTRNPQLNSCFLLGTDDSIDGIFKTISDSAKISKGAGGIGIHISNIRSNGSYIRGSNGTSHGIIPMCRVYNETGKYVNQGGKRNGSIAMYLELHHPDILDFLELRKNDGTEDTRCRDLFLAIMVSDLFMEKLEFNLKHPNDEIFWCLFDPDRCPGLNDVYGEEYKQLYFKYEREGRFQRKIPILSILRKILTSQIETGTPYILYKDRINQCNNQKNIGVIKSSNLCAEIVEYSDNKEYACCCLSSISLPSFLELPKIEKSVKIYTKNGCSYCVKAKKLLSHYEEINLDNDEERFKFYQDMTNKLNKQINSVPQIFFDDEYIGGYTELKNHLSYSFNYEKFEECCNVIVKNLNKIIDINKYPVIETKLSNFRHRPLGIGVQGLANLFLMMKMPFESKEALNLNRNIFEHLQYYCLKASLNLSKQRYEMMCTEEFYNFAKASVDSTNISEYEMEINDLIPNSYTYKYGNEMFTYVELENYIKNKDNNKFHGAYSTFEGSPLSNGIFHHEQLNEKPLYVSEDLWNELREEIKIYGVRNSLLIALMPTASTSQILGNNECFEPITSNIYTRRVLAGDYVVINKYLVNDLKELGLWNEEMKERLIYENGSVQKINEIPKNIKDLYKTAWEMSLKSIVNLSASRTPFICQTQSLNFYVEEPNNSLLASLMLYGWKNNLKTGSYYIRSRPKVKAQQFTIDPNMRNRQNQETKYDVCEACSG